MENTQTVIVMIVYKTHVIDMLIISLTSHKTQTMHPHCQDITGMLL